MQRTANPRPQERDIDIFGQSHVGKVRRENEDQHFAATLHKTLKVWSSSLAEDRLAPVNEPIMALMMVADGVGGRAGGRRASATALEAVSSYIAGAVGAYWSLGSGTEHTFLQHLERAVEQCHAAVRSEAKRSSDLQGMSTTLTMATVVWPRLYIVQVGDSRCYRLRGGQLQLLTTDQTLAQALLDHGVPPEGIDVNRLRHILSSAIGSDMTPVTTTFDLEWEDIVLLCTDGLTSHLADEDIRDVLVNAPSAKRACRALVSQALDRGGSDNVTVVVARLK
jgi:protein phosphatase